MQGRRDGLAALVYDRDPRTGLTKGNHMTTEQTSAIPASESAMLNALYDLSGAGASVIQVRTREPLRAAKALRKSILATPSSAYKEWDIVNGVRSGFSLDNYQNHGLGGGNSLPLESALGEILDACRDNKSEYAVGEIAHYNVFVDPHPFMAGNPIIAEQLLQLSYILPHKNATVILVTNSESLDTLPQGTVLTIDLDTPSIEELADNLREFIKNTIQANGDVLTEAEELSEDDAISLAQIGRGMSLFEFETHSAVAVLAGITAGETFINLDRLRDGLTEGKTEVIRQSEILELTQPGSIDDVGGMDELKIWLEKRKDSYTQDAIDFGIEAPKGMALVGVPGTGKSLVAKAVSSIFGVPMVRLDFSRVFSKYVGDSESRVRSALKMVEGLAPCVLFVDEIDKGLGGADGAGGDNGTSSRVLGTFLTWLNDHTKEVFTMVTANRVQGLPPELLRRGRFAQVFSVGLPDEVDRIAVLRIHLAKRGRAHLTFTETELTNFAAQSSGYVPAEIEAAVQDAIVEAYHDKSEDVGMQHILAALGQTIPMSVSNKERIDAIVAWSEKNAKPVASVKTRKAAAQAAEATARTIRRAARPAR